MNYTIFKPAKSGKGGILKFKTSLKKNDKKDVWEELLFAELVPQKTWNGSANSTYDPANKKVVKLSVTEAGEILHTLKTNIPFQTYHKNGEGGVWIKFAYYVTKRTFGREGDKGYQVNELDNYALGIGGATVSISSGEAEALKVYLEKYIVSAVSLAGKEEDKKFKKKAQNKSEPKPEAPKEESETEEDEDSIPF